MKIVSQMFPFWGKVLVDAPNTSLRLWEGEKNKLFQEPSVRAHGRDHYSPAKLSSTAPHQFRRRDFIRAFRTMKNRQSPQIEVLGRGVQQLRHHSREDLNYSDH